MSKDKVNFPRNSQFPVVVLKATKDELKVLANKLYDSNLLWIAYVQEMIDMIDDNELAKVLNCVSSEEMNILGIGMFGPKDKLKELTGTLRLWK